MWPTPRCVTVWNYSQWRTFLWRSAPNAKLPYNFNTEIIWNARTSEKKLDINESVFGVWQLLIDKQMLFCFCDRDGFLGSQRACTIVSVYSITKMLLSHYYSSALISIHLNQNYCKSEIIESPVYRILINVMRPSGYYANLKQIWPLVSGNASWQIK